MTQTIVPKKITSAAITSVATIITANPSVEHVAIAIMDLPDR